MGTDTSRPPSEEALFITLWDAHALRVLAYAVRHVQDHHIAQEVVSETFLVAWRRRADVPEPALPWLLVVARNTIANQRRSSQRRARLHAELTHLDRVAAPARAVEETVACRAEVLEALAALTPMEREALLLVAWDGLSVPDAARVAGCSTATFHVRLFRARRRLERHGADGPPPRPVAHVPATSGSGS